MAEQKKDHLQEMLRITDEIIKIWEEVGIDVEGAKFEDVIKYLEEWEKRKRNN